ncbi:MAG TPA: tetratricopeptide repeat protein [Saprospiraceae bacterium]|nr:tetratricopeptide repeat protein [Saprospiraceae bacterium]
MILPYRALYLLLLTFISLSSVTVASAQKVRPSSEQVTIEKRLIEGKKYAMLGQWEKAEAAYKAILLEDPQNSTAYYELSRTMGASGKNSDALNYVRKAIRIEPDNEWYLLMEADIDEKTGDLYSAMDVYDRLIRLKPERPHYYAMMINFCKKTNERERLLGVLDKYEQLTGVTESITRNRFEALDSLGRIEEALEAINRLVVAYPANIEYKFLAASYCKTKGMDDKALEYYKQIIALDPGDSRARLAMAGVEKKDGNKVAYLESVSSIMSNPSLNIDVKIQEMIPYVMELSEKKESDLGQALLSVIDNLIVAHPKEAKAYAIKGDVLSILDQKKNAIKAYSTSTAMNGNIYAVWEQLISLMIDTYAYDDVITQATKAIDLFPNQGYLYYAIGYSEYKLRRYDDALDMLKQSLIMTGKNINQKISVYNVLGAVYDELGQADKSYQAFETALSINPRSPETLSQYSLVLSRRIEQSDKAISMAEKALAEGSQSTTVHQWIAEVFYNQKKYDRARQSIEIALEKGTDPYGYNLAGDIYILAGDTDKAIEMWQKALDNGFPDPELKKKIAEHKGQ